MSWLSRSARRIQRSTGSSHFLNTITNQDPHRVAGNILDITLGKNLSSQVYGSDLRNIQGSDLNNALDYLNPITLAKPEQSTPDAPKPTSVVAPKPDLLFRRRASRANSGFRSLMIPLSGSARSQTGLGIPT